MRDVITIFAAGALMTTYAMTAPTLVGAVQSPVPVSQKVFAERLSQAGGEAPVSAVSGTPASRAVVASGSALPLFARH